MDILVLIWSLLDLMSEVADLALEYEREGLEIRCTEWPLYLTYLHLLPRVQPSAP